MGSFGAKIRTWILGLSPEEASFARRGFREGKPRARERLELIGRTFLQGYHAALREDDAERFAARLEGVPHELRGFAFEGAAMALALLDHLTPWNKGRFGAFRDGPGAAHCYMVHVGAGWALARLRRRVDRHLGRMDTLLCWLALDGYGFHQGYFAWPRYLKDRAIPGELSGYARSAFDQGLGRSLWFVEGADVARVAATIAGFPAPRRDGLWSGVGLACAYAGGVDRAAVEWLRELAGPRRPQLAQGAAFAAKARQRAGNPAEHTSLACEVLCGSSADEAARVTDEALVGLPAGGDGEVPAYEVWRRRIQAHWTEEVVAS